MLAPAPIETCSCGYRHQTSIFTINFHRIQIPDAIPTIHSGISIGPATHHVGSLMLSSVAPLVTVGCLYLAMACRLHLRPSIPSSSTIENAASPPPEERPDGQMDTGTERIYDGKTLRRARFHAIAKSWAQECSARRP